MTQTFCADIPRPGRSNGQAILAALAFLAGFVVWTEFPFAQGPSSADSPSAEAAPQAEPPEESPPSEPAPPAPAPPQPAPPQSEPEVTAVHVFPSEANLHNARDRQSFVVQALLSNGVTRDATAKAQFTFENPDLVDFRDFTVWPKADGETKLKIEYAGRVVEAPIVVANAADDPPVSFRLDVMPVFMRASCNTGSCHGAARGKDGFRLSLFGFDPDGDYFRLTREIADRRVNLALPESCLLIEKATGKVPHTGGKRIEEDSEQYAALVRWLKEGAQPDAADLPAPVSLEILPRQAVLEQGDSHRFTVRAKYSDGTDRDVTSLALFLSNNESAARIGPDGVATAAERGEAFVMARFAAFTVGAQVVVIPKNLRYEWPDAPEYNFIDSFVHAKLKKLRITPSELCTDEEFLRRVYLDVIGKLPSPAEYAAFMEDASPTKREAVVDDLLGRKEFSEIWVMKFAELLQIRTTLQVAYKPMLLFYKWLEEKIADNVPMNVVVQELLSANGGTFQNPATNYYQIETEPLKLAENVAQVFMGMRIQCAQCHNHPFDRWTMDDYYSFAAFFSQVGRKQAEDPREVVVFNSGAGDVKHLVGGRVMPPKFLGGETPDVAGKDRRKVLAEWLASPSNPYFAKNLANLVWAHFFGVGVVEPVDDVRVSNPASNPELLDALAERFTQSNYDFKKFVRDVCTSRTYQLSTKRNESNQLDERNFSHGAVRRIRAEVMLDAISQVTETKNKFQGLPLGARAVQIADGNVSTYFLNAFGRASRATVCSCEVKMEPNLSQALHLLNGETTTQKIAEGKVVERLLSEGKSTDEVVENLFIRCLTRRPTEAERRKLADAVQSAPDKTLALQDVFWAILNSKEFMFNH